MTFLFVAAALSMAQPAPAAHAHHQPAPQAAPAASARLSVDATPIADLLANEAAKAVIDRHIPGLSSHPQISQAGPMTLKAVQPYSGGMITDAMLEAVQRDLAALPAS